MELTVWDVLIVINTKMKNIKDPLQILQIWFSSSFPIGSFAYSHGLEAIIDDNKIRLQIEENKKRPKKSGGFSARLQRAMEQAEKQKKLKRKR